MKEFILCSAVNYNDTIVCGRRHKDCYHIIRSLTNKDIDVDREQQGFMTSTGRFVDRKEAWVIALNANQIIYGLKCSDNGADSELISENLYLNEDE